MPLSALPAARILMASPVPILRFVLDLLLSSQNGPTLKCGLL